MFLLGKGVTGIYPKLQFVNSAKRGETKGVSPMGSEGASRSDAGVAQW